MSERTEFTKEPYQPTTRFPVYIYRYHATFTEIKSPTFKQDSSMSGYINAGSVADARNKAGYRVKEVVPNAVNIKVHRITRGEEMMKQHYGKDIVKKLDMGPRGMKPKPEHYHEFEEMKRKMRYKNRKTEENSG